MAEARSETLLHKDQGTGKRKTAYRNGQDFPRPQSPEVKQRSGLRQEKHGRIDSQSCAKNHPHYPIMRTRAAVSVT